MDGLKGALAECTAAAKEVVTVMPKAEKVEGGRIMHIPVEAGYGDSKFFVDYDGSMPAR